MTGSLEEPEKKIVNRRGRRGRREENATNSRVLCVLCGKTADFFPSEGGTAGTSKSVLGAAFVLGIDLRRWRSLSKRGRRVVRFGGDELGRPRHGRHRELSTACDLVVIHTVIGIGQQRFVAQAVVREHRCASASGEAQQFAGPHLQLDGVHTTLQRYV